MKTLLEHFSKSWRNQFRLQFATLIVLIATFSVIILTLTFRINMERVLTLWGDNMQVNVYLTKDYHQDDVTAIESTLKSNPKVDRIQFVSQEKALEQFREQLSTYAPDLAKDRDLMSVIPASFQFGLSPVFVNPADSLSSLKEIASSLHQLPGVDQISYGQDWFQNYSSLFKTLQWIELIIISIVLISALFVIGNSIHSSIFQRKEEIEILELIGATSQFIRKPFLLEGMLMGALAYFMSALLSLFVYLILIQILKQQPLFLTVSQQMSFLSWETLFGFFFLSSLLGGGVSYICALHLNNGWLARNRSETH